MDVRNFRLRVILRGNKRLREDVELILRDYLRAGGMVEERILEVMDIRLENDYPAMTNDLPSIRTQDLKAMTTEKK